MRSGAVKMAEMNPTTSNEIQSIQRRMAQIRLEMHQEVRGAVAARNRSRTGGAS